MYWFPGSVDMRVTAPRSLRQEDHGLFQEAMERQGWSFTSADRDPMSTDYSLRHKSGPDGLFERWYADSSRFEVEHYLRARLLGMYEEMGLVQGRQALPLCDHCPSHASCWLGMEGRKATSGSDPEWSHVSLPWIGDKYSHRRIVVIGINPNEGGGLQFFPTLVQQAMRELAEGKILVNFGHETYNGTPLWHGIGAITAEILAAWQDDLDFSRLKPAETYPYLAFTNHIKCSPLDERSRPSNAMWKNCGETILKKELNILRPSILIVLGRGDNMFAMDHRVLDRPAEWFHESKYTRFGQGSLNGSRVVVLNVPLPAMGIGKSAAVPQEVGNMASRYQDKIKEIVGRY